MYMYMYITLHYIHDMYMYITWHDMTLHTYIYYIYIYTCRMISMSHQYPNVISQSGLGIQGTARQISLENGDVTGGDGKFHMPRQYRWGGKCWRSFAKFVGDPGDPLWNGGWIVGRLGKFGRTVGECLDLFFFWNFHKMPESIVCRYAPVWHLPIKLPHSWI